MRLLQQTETQVVYITTPTTLPTKAEIENAQLQGKSTGRIQVILLRSEDEDIQATSSSMLAFVDATSRMESVSIEQAEDSLFDLRRVIKRWLRMYQSHVISTIDFRSARAANSTSPQIMRLILRSNFNIFNEELARHLLHGGLAILTALYAVPLDSVDGSAVLGFPLNGESINPEDGTCRNLHHYLSSHGFGIVVKCSNPEAMCKASNYSI
ncbi:hypothetical protein AC1031_012110 [Aphanomyces cochlioides]|nr:hypothetical protein AC1031_012110 [Aphanomyces cochlioides]